MKNHTINVDTVDIFKELRKHALSANNIDDKLGCVDGAGNFRYHLDKFQSFIYETGSGNYHKLIKPLIVSACIATENDSAFGATVCLDIISNYFSDYTVYGDVNKKIETIKKNRQIIIEKIKKNCFKPDREDFNSIKVALMPEKRLIKIIDIALGLSSPLSTLRVEKSNKEKTVIKKSLGHNIVINFDSDFIGDKSWNQKNVECVVIDGFIESIGEIHHFLEKCSSDRQPRVMFVRDMAEEVKNIIIYNNKRGTINLMPICVGFDENSINVLNDIAILTDSDLISSYKGDLISVATRRNSFSNIEWIKVSHNRICFPHSSGEKIKKHISYLKSKRDIASDYSLAEMYDKRLKSLESDTVEILIGVKDQSNYPLCIEKIDRFLRLTRSIADGVVKVENITNNDIILDNIKHSIKKFDIIPMHTIHSSVVRSSSLIEAILKIGIGIKIDKKQEKL